MTERAEVGLADDADRGTGHEFEDTSGGDSFGVAVGHGYEDFGANDARTDLGSAVDAGCLAFKPFEEFEGASGYGVRLLDRLVADHFED